MIEVYMKNGGHSKYNLLQEDLLLFLKLYF